MVLDLQFLFSPLTWDTALQSRLYADAMIMGRPHLINIGQKFLCDFQRDFDQMGKKKIMKNYVLKCVGW